MSRSHRGNAPERPEWTELERSPLARLRAFLTNPTGRVLGLVTMLAAAVAALAAPVGLNRAPAAESEARLGHEPPPPLESPQLAPVGVARVRGAPALSATTSTQLDEFAGLAPLDGAGAERPTSCTLHVRVFERDPLRPVRDARLEVRHEADNGLVTTSAVATGAGGSWEGQLPPGKAVIVAWHRERVSAVETVELELGRRAERSLTVEPGLAVEGTVCNAVSGAPVEGASVSFWTHSELDRAITDSAGRFRHPRFPHQAAAHQVRIEAPGYGSEVRYLEVVHDGAWALPPAGAGDPVQRGLVLPVRLALELVPAIELVGRVTDSTGQPLADAEVVANGHFTILDGVAASDSAESRSDSDGRFRLAGLRADVTHIIRVRSVGFAARERAIAPLDQRAAWHEPVDLGDLVLERGASMAGQVVDAGGLPAEGLQVCLKALVAETGADPSASRPEGRDWGARLRAYRARGSAESDGGFQFADLASGRYLVRVRRGDAILVTTEVHVGAGDVRNDIILELPWTTHALTGVVTHLGSPLAGATVALTREREQLAVTTDEAGRFRAAGLADESYALIVRGATPAGEPVEASLAAAWPGSHEHLEATSGVHLAAR